METLESRTEYYRIRTAPMRSKKDSEIVNSDASNVKRRFSLTDRATRTAQVLNKISSGISNGYLQIPDLFNIPDLFKCLATSAVEIIVMSLLSPALNKSKSLKLNYILC